MADSDFDVIVVGGGLGGLCCAGELIRQGRRALLICETAEVGATIASTTVAGNKAYPQFPTWQDSGWGGGWWLQLVKAFNIPLRWQPDPILVTSMLDGDKPGPLTIIPRCTTPAGVTQTLMEMSGADLGPVRDEVERILAIGLNMSVEDLAAFEAISASKWLDEQQASEAAKATISGIFAYFLSISEDGLRRASVYACFGYLRTFMCGEATMAVVMPDNRDGLAVPLAKAIEQHGGEVWRGSPVANLLIEDGRASGVLLRDGCEVRAKAVAIAVGNRRIGKIIDPVPDEIRDALEVSFGDVGYYVFTALEGSVASSERQMMGVMSPTGENLAWTWPLHAIAPWTTQPGQQLIVSSTFVRPELLEELGGDDGAYERIERVHEAYWPGFGDAVIEQKRRKVEHLWFNQFLTTSEKLPRMIDSVPDLYFVGEGSSPIRGWAMEAAASAGILGARDIVARLHSS